MYRLRVKHKGALWIAVIIVAAVTEFTILLALVNAAIAASNHDWCQAIATINANLPGRSHVRHALVKVARDFHC